MIFSKRLANWANVMPAAWQTAYKSSGSRRRSPDSYLLTNDWGRPNDHAGSRIG